MTLLTPELSPAVPCHRCGYDVRAQRPDAACPECGASVAESHRLALIPVRPAWRASDPRWRRRVLAGLWTLALLPLMDVLRATGWAAVVPVPAVFHRYGMIRTLDDTLVGSGWVYTPAVFCVGVVLLFARERGRQPARLDWTRRWGVICAYVTFLIAASGTLFITALVCVGIGALFLSMPSRYQPPAAHWFVDAGVAYLRYGPQPMQAAAVVQDAASAAAVLLACVPVFNAVRSAGPKWLAATLVAPLALFSVAQLAQIAGYYAHVPGATLNPLSSDGVYFCPSLLAKDVGGVLVAGLPFGSVSTAAFAELAKWGIVAGTAVGLTIARRLGRATVA